MLLCSLKPKPPLGSRLFLPFLLPRRKMCLHMLYITRITFSHYWGWLYLLAPPLECHSERKQLTLCLSSVQSATCLSRLPPPQVCSCNVGRDPAYICNSVQCDRTIKLVWTGPIIILITMYVLLLCKSHVKVCEAETCPILIYPVHFRSEFLPVHGNPWIQEYHCHSNRSNKVHLQFLLAALDSYLAVWNALEYTTASASSFPQSSLSCCTSSLTEGGHSLHPSLAPMYSFTISLYKRLKQERRHQKWERWCACTYFNLMLQTRKKNGFNDLPYLTSAKGKGWDEMPLPILSP